MIERSKMVDTLRETFAHYYNAAYLQTCELGILVDPAPHEKRPLALRQLLREAIETLKPPSHVPYGQDEWIAHIALWERYVARRSTVAVYQELSMSRSAYYRAERRALEAVADLLWPQYSQACSTAASDSQAEDMDRHAIEEAVRIARTGAGQVIEVLPFLDTVRQMLAPLAASSNVELTFECHPSDFILYADPNTLRQIIISLVAAICRSSVHGLLRLSVNEDSSEDSDDTEWRFSGPALDGESIDRWPQSPGMDLPKALLTVYRSELRMTADAVGEPTLSFHLPHQAPANVLVVDDDARNQALYQRYLEHRYQLSVAQSAQEAWALLEERLPKAIILDVLMPHEDGWFLLQRLKSDPRTAALPVIIYSVLLQPNLAISLGAAAVLRKPIDEHALLTALRNLI